MRALPLIAALLLAAPLCAHESTIFCNLRLQGQSDHTGIKVTIEADPLWGHADEESLKATEEANGKFASFTVKGEGETDKNGALRLTIEFSFEGEGVRPTRTIWRDKQQVEVEYCVARLVARRDGYRPYTQSIELVSGQESSSAFASLAPLVSIIGSVIQLNDRSPVVDLELELSTTVQSRRQLRQPTGRRGPTFEYVQENKAWTLKTDANGRFELSDESWTAGRYVLTPLGGTLAFSSTSKAAREIHLQDGVNDLGALTVVPGGSLTFRLLNSDDDSPATANCQLQGKQGWRSLAVSDGVGQLSGVAEGEYTLTIRSNTFWESRHTLQIGAGKVTDLGDVYLDPILSLDVIALSDGATGIEQYRVTALMLEGQKPAHFEGRTDVDWIVNGQLTAERTTMTGLRKGKWLITVTAAGHAKAEAEVELPATKPLSVTLSEGGALEVSVRLNEKELLRDFILFAVRNDSDYYATLTALKPEEWNQLRIDFKKRGVYAAERDWGENRKIDAMAPGTYYVIAQAGNLGWLKQDNVEIEKGKTTTLELKPKPPSVVVAVTRDGEAASDVKLYIVLTGWNRNGNEFVEFNTDTDGKFTHEFKSPGRCYVLTDQELEYVGKPEQMWEWQRRLSDFKGDGTELRYGQKAEIAIELNDRNGIWVKLLVKLPEGVWINAPSLNPKIAPSAWRRSYLFKQIEGGWLYPYMPAGDYIASTTITTGNGERVTLTREITIDTPPEQTVEIEFEFKTFTISLNVPQGVDMRRIQVQLAPKAAVEDTDMHFSFRDGRPDAAGKVAFIGLEPGEYLVMAMAWADHPNLAACASQFVDTSAVDEITLELTKDFGTLDLRIEGNPALGGFQDIARWRVQLFNEMEEEVFPVNPWFAFGNLASGRDSWGRPDMSNAGIRGIPSGSYRILVTAHGLQPHEETGVEIVAGETTRLTVAPSAAAVLKLTLNGINAQTLNQGKATATYLDAAGNEVDVAAPDRRLFRLGASERADVCEARLLNLTPAVARVIVKIEGYEDVDLPVRFEPGKTILHTAEAKRRAD